MNAKIAQLLTHQRKLSCLLFWAACLVGCTVEQPTESIRTANEPLREPIETAQIRLDNEVQITESGQFFEPRWSPDGSMISFTGPRYRGLSIVPAKGGSPRQIADAESVSGYRHRWVDGPARILCPRKGPFPAVEISPSKGQFREIHQGHESIFARRDDVWLATDDGERRLTQGEDRFFDPVLSPNGSLAAVVGLATGIHVIDVSTGQALFHGGPGTHPNFTPDGAWLLYERTEDDGQRLTGSELLALSVVSGEIIFLTDTPEAIERHPSASPDGNQLAFIRDGAVWTADLSEVTQ